MEDFRVKVFTAVAAEGSFTKAAAVLGISQPAVSQNVAELEKYLGVKLFNRERGSVSLTPDGERFRQYAGRLEDAYGFIDAVFSPSLRNSSRVLRVATTDFLSYHVLPVLLKDFPVQYEVTYISNSYPLKLSDMPDDYDLCIYSVMEGEPSDDPSAGAVSFQCTLPSGASGGAFTLSIHVKASEEFAGKPLCKLLLKILSSR